MSHPQEAFIDLSMTGSHQTKIINKINNLNSNANRKSDLSCFGNKTYNQILKVFVELLPKFDKNKETIVEHSDFLVSLLELSFYLIINSNLVSFGDSQDLVEPQSPLPINFCPKSGFWSKILASSPGGPNSGKWFTGRGSYLEVVPLLATHEANFKLNGLLETISIFARTAVEEIKNHLSSNYNKFLLEGDHCAYPKMFDLKKSLKNKTKSVMHLLNLNKIHF